MSDENVSTVESDELIFADETEESRVSPKKAWKVMIVDDEEDVHKVTRMVLDDFVFEGKGLDFMSAYSGAEAQQMIEDHPDTALILLDVVMETSHAGLETTRYIRENLKNRLVRIILRTGQPGFAPEREVITKYDINDYKLKTILTDHTLFTTVVSAIRTYRDLKIIEKNRKGLEQIIDASASLFQFQSMKQFAAGVLTQLTSILGMNDDCLYIHASGFTAQNKAGGWNIIAGTGNYVEYVDRPVETAVPENIRALIMEALEKKESVFRDEHLACFFSTQRGSENLLYMYGYQRPLSKMDENMIRLFFTNVAVALDNIDLNREIVNTQKEVIFTLGEVVENRSKETANHVRRIAEFARSLGMLYGLDDKEAELIRLASPMHDVGKIGIPDIILNKPGKLTAEEFEIIKTHSRIGYDILKHSKREIMRTAAVIALEHHEKWNGSGYPQNLKGENIHLFSRIAAIVDVFDALSRKRIYKEAWDINRVAEYLKKERGRHFDPDLTDLFIDNLQIFLNIRKAFPDPDETL